MIGPRELIDAYLQWLRQNITAEEVNGWIALTTPLLDRHHDRLQVFVRAEEDEWVLTDDGYVLTDLAASGCDLSDAGRRTMLDSILAGFGVQVDGSALTVRAGHITFADRLHSLLQAMLAANDHGLAGRP